MRSGVWIALCEQVFEIFERLDGSELFDWRDVDNDVVLHAMHEDVRIRLVGEVSLNGFVGAVGVGGSRASFVENQAGTVNQRFYRVTLVE